MNDIIEEEEDDIINTIKEIINDITDNIENMNNYSNDNIIIVVNYFIMNNRINLIDNLLLYMLDNEYNINNFELYQETLIRSLIYYIINTKSNNILNDYTFNMYIKLIKWNETLYFLFMKLLIMIDNYEIFRYILNIAYDLYEFDINCLLDFIINPLNIDLHLDNDIIFNLKFTSLNIFKLLLDLTNDRVKIIEKYYKNDVINNYYKSELYLDYYNKYIYIDTDNCNYYIYKHYNDLEHISDNILKYLIINYAEDYQDCIDRYKLDPIDYIVFSVKYNNKFFFNKYINNRIDTDKYYNILNELSLLNNNTQINSILINKMITKRKMYMIDYNRIEKIIENSINNNYLLLLRILKYIKYRVDLNLIFRKIHYRGNINKLLNVLDVDFNDDKYINLYKSNNQLLYLLLKKRLLKDSFINRLFGIILDYNSNKFYIIQYIINNITLVFDYNTCFKLYNKKYYNALNVYLFKYYNNHRITYKSIEKYFPKIISFYRFRDLLLKIRIDKEDVNNIINNTYKLNKKHIEYIIKNIKKII